MSLVTVATYREPHGAHIARAALEDEGIPAFVSEENLVGVDWVLSQALGGVKVQVPEEYADRAAEILAEDRSAELGGVPEASLPLTAGDLCPACGSSAISPAPEDRRARALSLLLTIPFGFHRNHWRCDACGHRWRVRNPNYSLLAIFGYFVGFLLYLGERLYQLARRAVPWALGVLRQERRVFHCWRCDRPYRGGDRTCGGCGTPLPDAIASAEYVVRGRRYDDACPRCHTPFRRNDYLPTTPVWYCSHCGKPLPRGA